MKMKSLIALLVIVVFTLGIVGMAFAAGVEGTVTKIDGKKVTIKDGSGKETTVTAEAKDCKVGDKVKFDGSKLTKEGGAKKKQIEGC
jgi:hypothetical protein